MKYCKSCGCENENGYKFCLSCGAAFAQNNGGFCPHCGAPIEDGIKFCQSCGKAVNTDEKSVVAKNVGEKKPTESVFSATKKRVLAFESERHLVSNLIVAVCALVIMLVALFAPIKTVCYYDKIVAPPVSLDDNGEETVVFPEIDQSIWKILGSVRYLFKNYDQKVAGDVNKARNAAMTEFSEWVDAHSDSFTYDDDWSEKIYKKKSEIMAKHLSRTDYIAYMMMGYYSQFEDVLSTDPENMDEQSTEALLIFAALTSSVFTGIIVALLSIAVAITSLVFLIRALVGIAVKRKMSSPYKYLLVMLALAGTAMLISATAPVFKMGGGLIGVTVFAAVVLFGIGTFDSIAIRGDGVALSVKRAAIAAVSVVAFYMMCTNVLKFVSLSGINLHVPFGYSLYNVFACGSRLMFSDAESGAEIALYLAGGVAVFFMAIFFVSLSYAAMCRSLKRLALGDVPHSSGGGYMLAAAILLVLTVIASYAIFVDVRMRAQTIVSAVIMIAAFVFDKCYKAVRADKTQCDDITTCADNSAAND